MEWEYKVEYIVGEVGSKKKIEKGQTSLISMKEMLESCGKEKWELVSALDYSQESRHKK